MNRFFFAAHTFMSIGLEISILLIVLCSSLKGFRMKSLFQNKKKPNKLPGFNKFIEQN